VPHLKPVLSEVEWALFDRWARLHSCAGTWRGNSAVCDCWFYDSGRGWASSVHRKSFWNPRRCTCWAKVIKANRNGRSEMGWFLDVYLAYIARTLSRFMRHQAASSWPLFNGLVTGATVSVGGFGCPTATLTYSYNVGNETVTGTEVRGFLTPNSAKEYVLLFAPGTAVLIRNKPGTREVSAILERDQTRSA
jgi:hypothetical protein